jgi:3-dehydroquinate synthase
VLVGGGLLDQLGEHVQQTIGRAMERVFVVADAGLSQSTRDGAMRSLASAGATVETFVLSPSERVKSLSTLEQILSAMARFRLERSDVVVALGGGIVGDVAGFAAASYRRGVAVVQCPTTLLAMVDASVGGKTGVNLAVSDSPAGEDGCGNDGRNINEGDEQSPRLRKNFVGAFHQPVLVLADISVLGSLDDRFFRCGLAECIKHGMIAAEVGGEHADLGAWIGTHLEQIVKRKPTAVGELVERNVALKATVVGQDTREMNASGGRALLNLGHTFGHAIEPMPTLSPDGDPTHAPLMHGEAVALGLVASAHCSAAMDLCETVLAQDVSRMLTRAGLPTRVANLPQTQQVLEAMFHDKKVASGQLRLVLPTGTARATIVTDPPVDAVRAGIEAMRG